MKTNQILETIDRDFNGVIVRQRTQDSFFSLSNVLRVVNNWRDDNNLPSFNFAGYIKTQNVKEFLAELESKTGKKPYIKATKTQGGWVHPFFMLKILIHNNPKFEISVYEWLFDNLIQNRISSGDSYTRMCGVLFRYAVNKDKFTKNIKIVARQIKDICVCDDWNKATQEQLARRDWLQNMIADLAQTLHDSTQGYKLAIQAYHTKYLTNQIKRRLQ